ncbi:MAG: SdrD B-like domain-containing protein, partial [Saprospiraceae bacterium]
TIQVDFSETIIDGACANGYTIERTWTTNAGCGTAVSHTQTITVQDTTDPILIDVPANVTVDCIAIPQIATNITATDNCDTNPLVSFGEILTPGACENSYTLTRTWTATDDCGNEVSQSQIITVEDTQDPILAGIPADVTVDCNLVPAPATPVANDNCDTDVDIDFSETSVVDGCGFIITRTWTATDNCGNTVAVSQTITVGGDEPVLSSLPADLTVECNNVPTATTVTAQSNCAGTVQVDFVENIIPGACENSYTIERTWSIDASVACGTTISHTQTITVEDTQEPIIAGIPADVTIACDLVPAAATPVVTDNCDTDVDLDFNEIIVIDGCGSIVTRTWIATDNCGNTVEATQTITVAGSEPVFSSLPADANVECDNIPVAETVTASSDCIANIDVIFSENIIAGACENSYTIERTWSIDASSACGTTLSHTQTITVEDTQSPILAGIPASLNVGCGNVPAPAQPVATDNCDTDVDIIYNEVQTPLSCGYELVRTWTATDNCGNETSASQTITVEDTEDPVLIGVPADETASCDNIPLVAANVTVTDNCTTTISIDFVETTTPLACGYTLTRTWTATDDCGNTVSASQNITVGDNTPPTLIDVPANTTVECSSIPGAPYVGATDNCDFDVEAILTEVETPLACGYLITRTWTATDDCGNEVTGTQEVTVTDTEVPSLWEIPADLTVECGNVPAIDQGVGVLDNCDPDATLDFVESYIAGDCAENYIIVRTWTATDNCGNTISDSQYITVEDTQSPVLAGVPIDLTVDCNNVPTAAQPVATDNCDTDVDINFAEVSVADGCGYILTRTWTATDNCGNATEASQTITVTADAPILSTTPADLTVECNNIPVAAIVTAQSNCAGTVQVDFVENIIAGSCENNYTIERTWSVASGCGNGISHTQLITVEDTQSPILAGVPANLNVACGNVPAPANPVATDNCDTDVDISFNEIENPLACGYELIRTWTATDNCGNETSASQTITVEDTEDPILIGVPADEVVNCGTVTTPATVTATDNCDNDVDVSFSETSVVDGCQTIITRTWVAIDDCGNEVSETQTITVNADPATLSAMPADITVECSNIPVAADLSAFDGCTGNPIVLDFVENIIEGTCENSYTIERTWSVSSGCGNGISHTQLVTVEDNTNPTLIGVPADVNVECGMIPTTPIVTGTDNCDTDVEISFNEVETPAACGYILTRTWTATDNCGNSVSATQTINVGDNTPPVVAGVPANLTVECNDIPAIANNPIATDNCDADVEISFSETNTPGACADSYTLTRTWTATDDCGNTTEAVQTIFVQDTTDPTLIGVPNNLTIDLTQGQTIPTAPILIGTDNCDTDVDVTFEETQTGSGCTYTLERTWTATDNCGNTISATQTIEVIGGLNVSEIHADASCGENNGSIDLTVSGGVAPITFVWSNGVGNIEDQTGLAPGIYEVTITDGSGCAANLSIEILGTGALQADISATAVNCYDGNDGSINVTMVNGLAPFTYDWTGGIGNTPNPTNLTAGSYNVTITDANGCSVSTGANVNQPQELILTIDSDGGGCAGVSGTATANVDGGMMPYQYAWSNGQTTSTISNLTEGTYTVTITDNNGCTIEDEVTISSSSNLIVSIDKTDVGCYLGTDGTATASVIGGQPDYTYLWNNGETNATIINLEAGTYTVTITDGAGCTGTQTIFIISPPELQLTTVATEVTPIGNDGTATVTATGGTLPYEYIWSNGQTTQTATGLSVGNYTVTVIDGNGCFAIDQIDVNTTVPTGDVNIGDYVWFDTNRDGIQDIDEVGFNNVMVKLFTSGQDGIFGTLDDEIVATETTSNNPSNTAAGYYLFENVAAGTYQIEFMLSSLPNDYMLSLANQGMDDNLDSDANALTGRTSTFTVVAGQMDDLSFDAGVHPECNNVTTGGAILATQTICAGETPDLLVNSIYPTGGGGDLEYIWLVNTTGSPFSNTDPSWTIIQGATNEFYQPGQVYTNTYFVRCARRAGCTDYTGESNIVAILVTPLPSVEIEQAPSSLCLSESTSFQAAFAGATATYLWDFGADASPQTSTQRNVYNLTYSSTGTKTVTLTVENMGCSISTTHVFEVTDCLNDFVFTNFVVQPEPSGTEVLLDWTTQYEVNESRFFLEHSKNGDDFQSFEVRNANGSAQQINNYQAIHAEPYYGVNYYRIKYVDANGQKTYSKVEVVVFDNGTRDIHVYPNPVEDFTYVEFLTELREDATIEVVDMTGRVLSTQVVADGFRTYRVSLADYPAGTYLIWVRYNDYRKDVERVVKITE